MTRFGMVKLAAATALALASAAAFSASDYLLEIDGIAGEPAASGPQTIEVSSWSWGASNPTSVGAGGLSGGRASAQDSSATDAGAAAGDQAAAKGTPRKGNWDLATGKGARAASPASGTAASPQVGDVATLVVRLRESPTKASTGRQASACVAGEHIKQAVLKADGRSYYLTDVVASGCTTGADGMRRRELTGHVTLIK